MVWVSFLSVECLIFVVSALIEAIVLAYRPERMRWSLFGASRDGIEGPVLRTGPVCGKLDKCGIVSLTEPENGPGLSVQLDYRRSLWRDSSTNSADNPAQMQETRPIS